MVFVRDAWVRTFKFLPAKPKAYFKNNHTVMAQLIFFFLMIFRMYFHKHFKYVPILHVSSENVT